MWCADTPLVNFYHINFHPSVIFPPILFIKSCTYLLICCFSDALFCLCPLLVWLNNHYYYYYYSCIFWGDGVDPLSSSCPSASAAHLSSCGHARWLQVMAQARSIFTRQRQEVCMLRSTLTLAGCIHWTWLPFLDWWWVI